MEKKFSWIEEEVAEELEIRPEQQESFQALSNAFKALARERISSAKDTAVQIYEELEKDAADTDVVVGLIKSHIRERHSAEQLESLVDQTADFYNSLDAAQQKKLRKMAGKHIHRHL